MAADEKQSLGNMQQKSSFVFAPLWPGLGEEREEREPRERVFYTCTFPFIFLSSRRATAGRTDGQGRLFFSVLAMM